ncbi:MAG: hypothetical protein RLW62_04695, partial [Gammaproteobacteria bacterium]
MNNKAIVGALGAACLAFATNASAWYSWNHCGGGGGSSSTCDTYEWNFTSTSPDSNPPGIAVDANGYHQNTSSSNFIERPLTIYGSDHLSLNYLNQSSATDAANVGSGKEGSPYHAFDNSGGYDLVIFEFAAPVTISQISMGWWSSDSDFSLFAFEPVPPGVTPGTNTPEGSGDFTYTGMVGDGWNLIGSFDYDALDQSDGNGGTVLDLEAVTGGAILDYASSYWAVGAIMNSVAYSGPTYGSMGEGNDRFKIASIAGCYTDIPPPP